MFELAFPTKKYDPLLQFLEEEQPKSLLSCEATSMSGLAVNNSVKRIYSALQFVCNVAYKVFEYRFTNLQAKVYMNLQLYVNRNPNSINSQLLNQLENNYPIRRQNMDKYQVFKIEQYLTTIDRDPVLKQMIARQMANQEQFYKHLNMLIISEQLTYDMDYLVANKLIEAAQGFNTIQINFKIPCAQKPEFLQALIQNSEKNMNNIQFMNEESFMYLFDSKNTLQDYSLKNDPITYNFNPDEQYKVLYYNVKDVDEAIKFPDNMSVLYYINSSVLQPQINFNQSLTTLILQKCKAPNLSQAVNVQILGLINVSKIDVEDLSVMKKLRKLHINQLKTITKKQSTNPGDQIIQEAYCFPYLEHLCIEKCQMSEHITIDQPLPNLKQLFIIKNHGLQYINIDFTQSQLQKLEALIIQEKNGQKSIELNISQCNSDRNLTFLRCKDSDRYISRPKILT